MDAKTLLNDAIALHQAGRLDDAEARYRQVLARVPGQPDALHFLGLAAHQRGRHEEAVTLMDQALAQSPKYPACLSNRGNALLALGRVEEALAAFRAALKLKRDFPDAHRNLGNALLRTGAVDEAIASYRRALQLEPNGPEHHYNMGRACTVAGRHDDALRSYRRAVTLRPDYADALFNLGNVQQLVGDAAGALDSYRQVTMLRPGDPAAWNNLGAQLELGDRPAEAIDCYRRALALRPGFAEAHNNLGNALLMLGHTREAIASYREAIAANPRWAAAHNNLGNALQAAGQPDEALAAHDAALSLDPDCADARWNKAVALLLKGDFAAGWPLFEARFDLPRRPPAAPPGAGPAWRGEEPVAGRTILLHHEQGFGDTLQMLRYAPVLAARGARVVVLVPPPLLRVAATAPGVAAVTGQGNDLPAFDLHCPFMSLPLALGTTLDSIPADVPYLAAPADDQAEWAARLGPRSRPRVGLVWSGSTVHRNDRHRSLPLATLAPLLALPAEFHSLQTEYRERDLPLLAGNASLFDHAGELGDFAATAGLVGQLDLVITVDTAVAHLAGALGRPVWLLLPESGDYRWLLGRHDTPWYPTMRLYRQPAANDWDSVVVEVRAALGAWLEAATAG